MFQLMFVLGLLSSFICSEVVRVLNPQYEMQSLNDTRATEAEGALHHWSESTALRKELSRLREHYRKMHDHSTWDSSTSTMSNRMGKWYATVCCVSNMISQHITIMISQYRQRVEQNWAYLGSVFVAGA
jgi:hypothetical protein